MPDVKNGNILAADYVLSQIGLKPRADWDGDYMHGNPIWGRADNNGHNVTFTKEDMTHKDIMPDVHGMGARDAVYLIEKRGLKVKIQGRGRVVEQSIGAGEKIKKGMTCSLRLA